MHSSLQAYLRRACQGDGSIAKSDKTLSAQGDAAGLPPLAKTRPDNQIGSVRVLRVNDFELWRREVCALLKEQTELQSVGEVADGLEAVQKAQELEPDLILLDIGLPSLNELEAAGRIRQVAPGAKILFLTQIRDKDKDLSILRMPPPRASWLTSNPTADQPTKLRGLREPTGLRNQQRTSR
jgi:CheY-like chemotaxis protein